MPQVTGCIIHILGSRCSSVEAVITVALARALQDAGLAWSPSAGDRFVVVDRDMDDQIFVLSDMTVEIHDLAAGQVIRFNGTTEWALDSLELDEVVWLPDETQLRALLGESFLGLSRTTVGYAVAVTAEASSAHAGDARPADRGHQDDTVVTYADVGACDAYARAALAVRAFGPR